MATNDIQPSSTPQRFPPGGLPPILGDAEEDRRLEHEVELHRHTDYYAAGRVLLASVFLLSGATQLVHFDAAIQDLTRGGVPDASLVLPIALFFELVGGALLTLGCQTRLVAVGLMLYLFVATVVAYGDLTVALNQERALYNVGLIGGLLMVAAYGGGAFSIDELVSRRPLTRGPRPARRPELDRRAVRH